VEGKRLDATPKIIQAGRKEKEYQYYFVVGSIGNNNLSTDGFMILTTFLLGFGIVFIVSLYWFKLLDRYYENKRKRDEPHQEV
jgi:hypothetical protein